MFSRKEENVIVVGVGRFGANLAGLLSNKGYNVTVLDRDENSFRKLPNFFTGFEQVGDGTDPATLENVGIKYATMLIAATNYDNINNLTGQIASRIYRVPRVFVRFNDVEKGKLIEGFNIEAIYPYLLSMKEFEKLSLTDLGGFSV